MRSGWTRSSCGSGTSPTVHPETGVPFSDRRLVECMREGARRFGWERRPARPGEPARGPVAGRLWHGGRDPHALPRTGKGEGADGAGRDRRRPIGHDRHRRRHVHDPDAGRGRGARAADRSRAGRARAFRLSGQLGSGGSWGAANSSTAVHRACQALREKLAASACNDARSPLHGRDPQARYSRAAA